jgi:hypothetical protein
MTPDELALILIANGFRAKVYRETRIYLGGYGRDISAWLEKETSGALPADGSVLHVRSSWRSQHNALRCKGVKHAILLDLHAAGLLSVAPPDDWRRVTLEEPRRRAPVPSGH